MLRKMLSVPIGFEIRVDLGVNQEHAARSVPYQCTQRIEVVEGPYRRRLRTVATGNSGEIRFRELHDIDRKALTPEEVHFSGVRTVIVDQDAHAQPETDCSFEIRDRHHEAAVTGAEDCQLARICDGEADGRCQAKTDRLE